MNKIYELDGVKLKIKDLTMNEVKKFNSLFQYHENTFSLPEGKSQKFFSMILTPAEPGLSVKLVAKKLHKILLKIFYKIFRKEIKIIYPGDCSDSTLTEITRDFFLSRIETELELRNSFSTLTEKLKKRQTNMKM